MSAGDVMTAAAAGAMSVPAATGGNTRRNDSYQAASLSEHNAETAGGSGQETEE